MSAEHLVGEKGTWDKPFAKKISRSKGKSSTRKKRAEGYREKE